MFTARISLGSLYGAAPAPRKQISGLTVASSGTSLARSEIMSETSVAYSRRSSFLPVNTFSEDRFRRTSKQPGFAYGGGTVYKLNDKNKEKLQVKRYCTGSKYIGDFNELGMAGKGIYKFPHGVIYDGNFNRRGEFHGTGMLIYPGGQRIQGFWRDGKMIKQGANYISSDNATFRSNLCKIPDRRFQIEVENDIQPAGLEYNTRDPRPKPIPAGCYDIGQGFYDTQRRLILDYDDPTKRKTLLEMHEEDDFGLYNKLLERTTSFRKLLDEIRRRDIPRNPTIESMPTEEIEEWIKANCRKAWDEPVGYRLDLYETWTAGYSKETNLEDDEELTRATIDMGDEVIRRFSQVDAQPKISPKQQDVSNMMYSFIRNQGRKMKQRGERGTTTSLSELASILKLFGDDKELSKRVKKSIFHYQKKQRMSSTKSGTSLRGAPPVIKFGRHKIIKLLPAHTWSNKKRQLANIRTVVPESVSDER